jgi:hypothetical protein
VLLPDQAVLDELAVFGDVVEPAGGHLQPASRKGVEVINAREELGRDAGHRNVQRVGDGMPATQVHDEARSRCLYALRVPWPVEAATLRATALPSAAHAGRSSARRPAFVRSGTAEASPPRRHAGDQER